MTEKEIFGLAGQVEAACLILREVRRALYNKGPTTIAMAEAENAAKKANVALRAISYEVENVRKISKNPSR